MAYADERFNKRGVPVIDVEVWAARIPDASEAYPEHHVKLYMRSTTTGTHLTARLTDHEAHNLMESLRILLERSRGDHGKA